MKSKIVILLCSLFFSLSSGFANRLNEAAHAYEEGDFNKCITLYNDAASEDGVSSSLLSNLGNAYVKTGDYGHAMVCYQRGLLLNPSDRQIKTNIIYLQSKIDDNNKAETKGKKVSVFPQDKSFFSSLRDYIVYSHLADTWALWAGITFVLTCVCAALYIFSSVVPVRKFGFFGGFLTLLISIITLAFSLISVSDRKKSERGVIISHKIVLHEEPYQSSKTVAYPLTRGTILNISGEESDGEGVGKWYKVRLNTDYTGWIKSNDFEII